MIRLALRLLLLCIPLIVGFRNFPGGNSWHISKSDSTLWVRSCRKPTFLSAEFPAGDPLYGLGIPTYDAALQTILDDINGIPGAFLRLALYPDDPANPPAPQPGDSTFTAATAAQRTIDICFTDQVITSGHARPHWDATGQITSCEIRLDKNSSEKAHHFVKVLTHELGHCFGLDHPQETEAAIMSYFGDVTRLQIDDKMGLTYLYPLNDSYKHEAMTFGLSCSPK